MKFIPTLLLASAALLMQLPVSAETQSSSQQQRGGEGTIASISGDDFNQFIESGVVVVDFYADWCGPCKKLHPIFTQLAQNYQGKVRFAKINIDNARSIANQYNVKTIPTVILFKNGKEIKRHGPGTKQQLINWIEGCL